MNLILFGGNSQRNKQWIHWVDSKLSPYFDDSIVVDYGHWDGKGDSIDFNFELSRLSNMITGNDEYIVFAKSVGSILALKAMPVRILQPSHCIFTGLPISLYDLEDASLIELLQNNNVPTTIFQNSEDPMGRFDQLKDYINKTSATNYKLHELNGNTHSYDDLGQIIVHIQKVIL